MLLNVSLWAPLWSEGPEFAAMPLISSAVFRRLNLSDTSYGLPSGEGAIWKSRDFQAIIHPKEACHEFLEAAAQILLRHRSACSKNVCLYAISKGQSDGSSKHQNRCGKTKFEKQQVLA